MDMTVGYLQLLFVYILQNDSTLTIVSFNKVTQRELGHYWVNASLGRKCALTLTIPPADTSGGAFPSFPLASD
jgi:hypothetical protein